MMYISVIIPTLNRANYLKETIHSILIQKIRGHKFEIIVVDNGSTDGTAEIIKKFIDEKDHVKYLFATEPGLHVGRHLGAREAQGDILVFIDDDVITAPGWLEAIRMDFHDPNVALVGGKILPKWEFDIPEWINLFKSETEYGWTIGYLSLLDFGEEVREIPAYYVYGCNFSIRKSVIFECGGFHPDSMPQNLIRYRGDGETALSLAIMEKGYKSIYEPKATVYHRIPPERLTVDYFCRRAFNQGVSDSYTEIRRKHGLNNLLEGNSNKDSRLSRSLKKLPHLFAYWRNKIVSDQHFLQKQVTQAYKKGKSYHRRQVAEDPKLLEYVLRERYF